MLKYHLITFFTIVTSITCFPQDTITKHQNTATVYFVRVAKYAEHAQFTLFDGDQLIHISEGVSWYKHECEAGEHLFWITNRKYSDFVESYLDPGKFYMLMIDVRVGYGKASTRLRPKKKGDNGFDRGIALINELAVTEISAEDLAYKVKNLNKKNIIQKQLKYFHEEWKFPSNYITLDHFYTIPENQINK